MTMPNVAKIKHKPDVFGLAVNVNSGQKIMIVIIWAHKALLFLRSLAWQ